MGKISQRIYTEAALEKLALDNSIMSVFALCPRKFFYRKVLKLVSKIEAPPLTFGSSFHEALFTYYSFQGKTLTDEQKAQIPVLVLRAFAVRAQEEGSAITVLKTGAIDKGNKEEYSIEFGLELVARYMEKYPLESESFRVKQDADGNPMLEIGFAMHLRNGVVVGKLDGVIDEGDLLENKTTTLTLNDQFLAQYSVHNQLSLYLAALRELTGRTPRRCVVNVIRAKDYKREKEEKKEQKLFTRAIIHKTDSQLDQILEQYEYRVKKIKEALEAGFDAFYQNAPEACTHRFRLCEYHPLCMAQEEFAIEMLMESAYKEEEWEPYDVLGAKKTVEIEPKFEA